METERRVRLVSIGDNYVLEWFAMGLGKYPDYVNLPKIEGLPSDAKVLGVTYDWPNAVFLFKVSHPSFSEVQDGERIPNLIGVNTKFVSVPIAQTDDVPMSPLSGMVRIDDSDGNGGYIVPAEIAPALLKKLGRTDADAPHVVEG